MSKAQEETDAIGDRDVVIRHMAYLPAAGLSFGVLCPTLESLAALLPGATDFAIVKTLPVLEPFIHEEFVDADTFSEALSGTPGFIFQMETPKRRWFSDGTERVNWGDTWCEWAYAKDQSEIRGILERWVDDVQERDGRQFPRVIENIDAE